MALAQWVLSKMVAIMFCVSPVFPDNEPLEGCVKVFFSSAPQTQMVPGTQVFFFFFLKITEESANLRKGRSKDLPFGVFTRLRS